MRHGIKDLGFGWRAGRVKSPKRPSREMGESETFYFEEKNEKMESFFKEGTGVPAQPFAACARGP
jgi:hypothetical protein